MGSRRGRDCKAQLTGSEEGSKLSVFGYRGSQSGSLVTLWRSSDTPGKRPEFEQVRLTIDNLRFEAPVWIDLLTGRVYELGTNAWETILRLEDRVCDCCQCCSTQQPY